MQQKVCIECQSLLVYCNIFITGLTSTTTTRNFFPSRVSPEEELLIMLGVMFPKMTARLVKFHISFYGTINQM